MSRIVLLGVFLFAAIVLFKFSSPTSATSLIPTPTSSQPNILLPAATSKVYLPFVSVPQASAPLPSANLLWSASMETGDLTQWNNGGGEFNSGNADTVASRDVARGGSWSAKLVATTPPESGTRLFRWHESQTYSSLYYSVWYYFPRNYSAPNYWNIFQWKSKISESIVDPFYVLNVGNRGDGSMYLYLYDWQRRNSVGSASINVPVGQWMRIEAYYKCAPDSSGAVTIWQNGTQIINHSGRSTRYSNGDCQWSVNNYSDSLSPSPATIYSDDAGISQSRIP